MVLEGATADDDFSRRDASPDSPASDGDAYSTRVARIADANVQIDLRQLPRPLPILGPLTGFGEATLVDRFTRNIAQLSGAVNRPLTAAECQSVAYYAAKANAIASYGFPVGAAGGLYREYKTRAAFKFPFFAPDMETFNSQKLGPLTGLRAEMGWHFLRRMSYGFFGGAVGTVIVGTYAAATAAAGQRVDPRMADIVEALKGMTPTELRNKARGGSRQQEANREQVQTQRRDEGAYGFAHDDTSPTGSDTGVLEDGQMRAREVRQQGFARGEAQSGPRPGTFAMETAGSQPLDFDDASPTAGNEPLASQMPVGGNAWERLRRENTASQGARGSRPNASQMGSNAWADRRGASVVEEQKRGSTVGDSFSFSRSDEERALAKQEAQREFDARVERERSGQFDDDNKWR